MKIQAMSYGIHKYRKYYAKNGLSKKKVSIESIAIETTVHMFWKEKQPKQENAKKLKKLKSKIAKIWGCSNIVDQNAILSKCNNVTMQQGQNATLLNDNNAKIATTN